MIPQMTVFKFNGKSIFYCNTLHHNIVKDKKVNIIFLFPSIKIIILLNVSVKIISKKLDKH